MADDEFTQLFGGAFAQVLVNELFNGAYIEVHSNHDVTVLIPSLGYRTIRSYQLSDNSSEVSFSADDDFVYLSTEGLSLVFRRATDEEAETYEDLLETAHEITDGEIDSLFDMTGGGTDNGIPSVK